MHVEQCRACDIGLGWAAVCGYKLKEGLEACMAGRYPLPFPLASLPPAPPRHLAPAGADLDTSYTMAQGLLDGDLSWQIGGEQGNPFAIRTAVLGKWEVWGLVARVEPLPRYPTPLVPPPPCLRSPPLVPCAPACPCPSALLPLGPLFSCRHPGQPQRVVGARQDCGGPPPPVSLLEGERGVGYCVILVA
jgi:hypothetical protein